MSSLEVIDKFWRENFPVTEPSNPVMHMIDHVTLYRILKQLAEEIDDKLDHESACNVSYLESE